MRTFLTKLFQQRAGATAIEYGLIAALIAVVTIAGLTQLGTNLNSKYNTVATDVGTA
jgi:pilus assembly protein Flp/PilA